MHRLSSASLLCRVGNRCGIEAVYYQRYPHSMGHNAGITDLAHEEIGHEYLVLMAATAIGMGQDIGTLNDLVAVAEDVIDYEDGGCGTAGPGGVTLHAIEFDVFTLWTVALRYGWGDIATCL